MAKVCLVIMDGASHDAVLSECGYLEAAVEAGHARRWKMRTCLPTISAAMYETIHTGLAPVDHGILGNDDLRPTRCANLFHTLKSAGKIGAAVAHSYYHTLYGGTPFDVFEHIEIDDASAPIPFARYYTMEGYGPINSCLPAEIDLCAQAWGLVVRNSPDYLLVHSCGPDTLGHTYTGDSPEYRKQIWRLDNALSRFIPRMTEAGYQVMVTADHGQAAQMIPEKSMFSTKIYGGFPVATPGSVARIKTPEGSIMAINYATNESFAEEHTGVNVAIFANQTGHRLIKPMQAQSDIFDISAAFLGLK